MVKNASLTNEGDFTYLRINFTHPGSQIGKESAQFPNALAKYLKELYVFRVNYCIEQRTLFLFPITERSRAAM
jgi:nucleosome binding factor SPN SPT16 subunit